MKILKGCLYVLFISLVLFSCAGRGGSSKKNFRTEIDNVSDSLQRAWKQMIEADDRKLADVQRLLQEVSYTQQYNEAEQQRLLQKVNQVKSGRYQQESMTSASIDNYDSSTDSLITQVFQLTNGTVGIENHPLAEKLMDNIKAEDAKVILYRVEYDYIAKRFNKLIEANQAKLQKMGLPYSQFKPKPIFELPQ